MIDTTRGPRSFEEHLRHCDMLRSQGRWLAAQEGYEQVLDWANVADEFHGHRSFVFAACQKLLETARDRGTSGVAVHAVSDCLSRLLPSESWRSERHDATSHIARAARFELSRGREDAAAEMLEFSQRLGFESNEELLAYGRLALTLNRTTIEALEVYVQLLVRGVASPEEHQQLERILRESLVQEVELEHPEEDDPTPQQVMASLERRQRLQRIAALSRTLWEANRQAWCLANFAICELSLGSPDLALELVSELECGHLDPAEDAAGIVQTAFVYYVHGDWKSALAWLRELSDTPPAEAPWSEIARPLEAMAKVNHFLTRTRTPDDNWLQDLECQRAILAAGLPPRDWEWDGQWVLGAAANLLGSTNDIQQAISAFNQAPGQHLAWRFAEAEMEARWIAGQADGLSRRVDEWCTHPNVAPALPKLIQAKVAVIRADYHDARGHLAAAEAVLRKRDEADLHLAACCLRGELSLASPRPEPPLAVASSVEERASTNVVGWWRRVQALLAIEVADMTSAERLLADPIQRLAPPSERRHALGTLQGMQGRTQHVAEELDESNQDPGAQPQHRLAFLLWLTRDIQQRAQAIHQLAQLKQELPQSVEIDLALGNASLQQVTAESPAHLAADDTPSIVARLGAEDWLNAPRFALLRPWYAMTPVSFWPRAAWSDDLKVSPHRIADILYATEVMLDARAPNAAIKLIDMLEPVLDEDVAILAGQFANLLMRAAVQLFERREFVEACAAHHRGQALFSQTSETQNPEAVRNFVVGIAESLSDLESTPPDDVLEVLASWVRAASAAELADDASQPAEQTSITRTLERLLLITDRMPGSQHALSRRRDWCERIATESPTLPWPHRHLAEAALRRSEFDAALRHVEQIAIPGGDDKLLRGRIFWRMEDYAQAAIAFDSAATHADCRQEAVTWQGIAECARLLMSPPEDGGLAAQQVATAVASLTPDRAVPDLLNEALLWRASVQLAAGLTKDAATTLDLMLPSAEQETKRKLLDGIRLAQEGHLDTAIDTFDAMDAWGSRAIALHLRLRGAGREDWTRLRESLREQTQLGRGGIAMRLSTAWAALLRDDVAAAQSALTQHDHPPDPMMRVLDHWLEPFRHCLLAKTLLADGNVDQAWRHCELAGESAEARLSIQALQAQLLQATGQWAAARDVWTKIASEAPDSPTVREAIARRTLAEAVLSNAISDPAVDPVVDAQLRQHPIVLMASALVAERRQQQDEAQRQLQLVAEMELPHVTSRERAVAATGVARLLELQGRFSEAQQWHARAANDAPAWPLPQVRLALLRARLPDIGADARQQSIDFLASRMQQETGIAERLALISLATAQAQWALASRAMAELMEHAEWPRLPDLLQAEIRQLAAEVHWLGGDFSAAATAYQSQISSQDSSLSTAELTLRLEQCHMRLASEQLAANCDAERIAAARESARRVLALDANDLFAVALLLLCELGSGEVPDADTATWVEQLRASAPDAGYHSFADEAAKVLLPGSTSHGEGQLSTLELLAANRAGDVSTLVFFGQRLLLSSGSPGDPAEPAMHPDRLPFPVDALAQLAVADEWHRGSRDRAMELGERWRVVAGESQSLRSTLSRMHAHFGVRALRKDLAEQAIKHLNLAVDLAQSEAQSEGQSEGQSEDRH